MRTENKISGIRIDWKLINNQKMQTMPKIHIAGFSCYFLLLKPNVKHKLISINKKIVICIEGKLEGTHRIKEGESMVLFNAEIISGKKNTLLFICDDFGDNKKWMETTDLIRWQRADEIFPGLDIELYRSTKFTLGNYRINFWYSKPNVNCGIHKHAKEDIPFLEFHVQLRGFGWMEIFANENLQSKKEEVFLDYGQAHRPFYFFDKNDKILKNKQGFSIYPFHQMRIGKNGSLFVVFERINFK